MDFFSCAKTKQITIGLFSDSRSGNRKNKTFFLGLRENGAWQSFGASVIMFVLLIFVYSIIKKKKKHENLSSQGR